MIIKSDITMIIACIKWMKSKSIILLGSNIDDIGSKSNVMRKQTGSATKISASCPQAINT